MRGGYLRRARAAQAAAFRGVQRAPRQRTTRAQAEAQAVEGGRPTRDEAAGAPSRATFGPPSHRDEEGVRYRPAPGGEAGSTAEWVLMFSASSSVHVPQPGQLRVLREKRNATALSVRVLWVRVPEGRRASGLVGLALEEVAGEG